MHQGSETGKLKAVGLLSGGLDSTLAAQLMLEQGIEVYAINFTSPFCLHLHPQKSRLRRGDHRCQGAGRRLSQTGCFKG